ncbi:MAG: hypothetical protein EOP52_12540 [Sphingobacteriales bacterium]|nr:MAG: hypothetical protein EOP52_12540 [Sphingobacteriales bacterium]
MRFAYTKQSFQDWFTQQWVIFRGSKTTPAEVPWLAGPFGDLNGIGADFITRLAAREQLTVERNPPSGGLLSSMRQLELTEAEYARLSPEVIRFYEGTANYTLDLRVAWNPVFKGFGTLVNTLFSTRINQLNIPIQNVRDDQALKSEIITLSDPGSGQVKYRVWLRTFQATGKVVYMGIYGTCRLPSGKVCVKAVFPLPNGNATVIMEPGVTADGALILDGSGKKSGDAGFYFQLQDAKGDHWVHYVRPFRDRLVVRSGTDGLTAEQTLTLWGRRVLTFYYQIRAKTP